jgi:signal transduction histidine kinase
MTSHEFRTPLATIQSSAELLERYSHKWTVDKRAEHLRRIQTATRNMTALLEDVLLVGKAEAGKLEFAPAPLNLEKFCRDMIEELQLGLGAKHSLVLTIEGDGTAAYLDEKLLRHILSNLLSNAIKYSLPGSEVSLGLTCQAGQASLVIRDQGIGIPPADRARLFEAFHRADNVKNIPGTGLGLAIVKNSVDVHGGTLEVYSQLGVGTTITVTLPMQP